MLYIFQEVLKERECQIKSKEKRKEEGKRKEVEENTFAELLRLESLQVDKENKQRVEKQQKEYRMDLAKQIEYNKQQLVSTTNVYTFLKVSICINILKMFFTFLNTNNNLKIITNNI